MLIEIRPGRDEEPFEVEQDEVGVALAGLRELMAKVSNPVVRACLEEAQEDIMHLTGRDVVSSAE
jgi:hypothetical protein